MEGIFRLKLRFKKAGIFAVLMFFTFLLIGGNGPYAGCSSSNSQGHASSSNQADTAKTKKLTKQSPKEASKEVPSWARGKIILRPGEDCHQLAIRLLNEKYGVGNLKKVQIANTVKSRKDVTENKGLLCLRLHQIKNLFRKL